MIAPLLNFVDKGALRSRTVAQGLVAHLWVRDLSAGLSVPALVQYLHLWNKIVGLHLLEHEADCFKWTWTTSSDLSAKLAYLAFIEGHTLWPLHDPIRKCRAPLKFKLFGGKWCGTAVGRVTGDFAMIYLMMTPAPSVFNVLFRGAFGLRSCEV
jgi:hypothetical protein